MTLALSLRASSLHGSLKSFRELISLSVIVFEAIRPQAAGSRLLSEASRRGPSKKSEIVAALCLRYRSL